jgi:hypothetical protein
MSAPLRTELRPFTLKETAGYIATRITVAGGRADAVLTRDAVIAIHEAASGLPRTISVIAHNALLSGLATRQRPVGSALVREVCRDFKILTEETHAAARPVEAPKPSAADGVTAEPFAAAGSGSGRTCESRSR